MSYFSTSNQTTQEEKEYERRLHRATQKCDAETVKSALGKGDVDAVDEEGRTALHVACSKGFVDIARMLLDSGADLNNQRVALGSQSHQGFTALHVGSQSHQGFTALHVGSQSHQGFTALHVAAMNGRLDAVKLLLRRGADVHLVGSGYTALHLSCRKDNWEAAAELLDYGADINAACTVASIESVPKGGTSLHLAAEAGSEETVRLLLARRASINIVDQFGETCLHRACQNGQSKIAELLLKNGVCVNATTWSSQFEGYTALHYAAKEGLEGTVGLLLDSGADVEAVSRLFGMTALHYACEIGSPDTAERLLQHGARTDVVVINALISAKGYTPLHCAAAYKWTRAGVENQLKLIEVLLEWHADVNAVDEHGNTPLDVAIGTWSDRDDRHERAIVNVFVKNFVKMQNENLILRATNLEVLTRDDATTDFSRRCQDEIDTMKKTVMADSNVSLFDILTHGTRRLANYMESDSVANDLESSRFETEFPIYSYNICYKTRQARKRRDLQRQSYSVLKLSNLRYVPYLCIKRINRYLNNKDLTKIIMARPSAS